MRRSITTAIIIETAIEIADIQGLDTVNLTSIAEKLDVKKQSLYNHVENLAQIKCDMVVFACTQLRIILAEAAIGQSREQAVFAVSEAYRRFAHEHPGQYQVIMSDAWKYKANEKMKESIHAFMDIIRKVLSQYNLEDVDLTHAARGLRSVMHGFVSLEASGWFQNPTDKSESYHQLIRAYIYGIETWEIKKMQEEK